MTGSKGFTLMELLVAVFIGSMVTISLVSIWKGASLQTSQGQRQSIIRNNLSLFLRGIHKDITESDVILYPNTALSEGSALLVCVKNAHKDNSLIVPSTNWFIPESKYFSYCLDTSNANDHKVRRKEGLVGGAQSITDFLANIGDCAGTVVMDNVSAIKVTTTDNVNYNLDIQIHRDFADKTTPIHIEFQTKFVTAGGS